MSESTGLPLLPKFKGTGLSVKEALEASLVAAGVEPGQAASLAQGAKVAKPAKVAKIAKVKVAKPDGASEPAFEPSLSGGTKYQIHIPAALLARVMKPVTGQGGWQTTATLLQQAMIDDGAGAPHVLYLDIPLWARILHQSITGSGGWQSVCRHVVCLVVSKYGVGAGA